MRQYTENSSADSFYSRLIHPSIRPVFIPLLAYSAIMFLVYFADGIMSYVSPVYIEQFVHNAFLMGIVLASSSTAGIVFDALIPSFFRSRSYLFFLWATVLIALLFPLAFIFLPTKTVTLILAMVIWGIYYEFLLYSNFQFIHAFTHKEQHPFSWGLVSLFKSLAYLIAPVLASTLLHVANNYPLYGSIIFYVFAAFGIIIFGKVFPDHKKSAIVAERKSRHHHLRELKIWSVLLKKLWPMYIFTMIIVLIDSTYFTIGVLLSEEMQQQSFVGKFLLPAYLLPSIFMGLFVSRGARRYGKKRLAFISGICSGALLFMSGFAPTPELLVILMFFSSVFSSLAFTAILSSVQDFVGRLGSHNGDVIGLQNSASSLAYIIGPVISGALAALLGNQLTFGVIGGLLFLVSVIALVVVPRKIHLPQTELAKL